MIHGFIRELAEYEKMLDKAVATVADIDAALFSEHPRVFCDIAEMEGRPVGFALWFYNFSTSKGDAASTWKTSMCGPKREARARAKRSWRGSPNAVSTKTSVAWTGPCWIGTSPPSPSTTASALSA